MTFNLDRVFRLRSVDENERKRRMSDSVLQSVCWFVEIGCGRRRSNHREIFRHTTVHIILSESGERVIYDHLCPVRIFCYLYG